jgi:hypothetical protein
MSDADQQAEGKRTKPSRADEARRIIDEYANHLREIIKKRRRKMN